MDTKTCSRCKRELPATREYFYARKRRNGTVGLDAWCRTCYRAYQSSYRGEHHEHFRELSKASCERNRESIHDRQLAAQRGDRERFRGYGRRHYALHREEIAARRKADPRSSEADRKYYATHREQSLARNAAYRQSHPEVVSARDARRRALERNAPGTHSAADVARIRSEQGNRCFWCGEPLGRRWHLDHYIPLSKGGSNWPENLDVACARCNLSKHDLMPGEFLERLA
jgi:5-methylcytosine-specific restriction endonuclease McrA